MRVPRRVLGVRRIVWSAAAMVALAGCTAPAGDANMPPIEAADPLALAWVAPGAADSVEAGDLVGFAVATQHPDARVVHFEVDGTEVATCDPSSDGEAVDPGASSAPDDADDPEVPVPAGNCHDDVLWRAAATLGAAGSHTLRAWFDTPAGARVEAVRTITAVATGTLGDGTTGSSPDPDDDGHPAGLLDLPPGPTGSVAQAVLSDRGFSDPSHGFDSLFGGREWSLRRGYIVLRNDDIPMGSVVTAARCVGTYGASVSRYGHTEQISNAALIALAVAETNCTAHFPGGPLRVPVSVCTAVNPGLNRADCARRLRDSPDFAIATAARYLGTPAMRRVHHNDPVRLAAAYRSMGALHRTRANPWHVMPRGDFLDRFVQAYNAWTKWADQGGRTHEYTNPLIPFHCPDPTSLRVDSARGPTYYIACTSCYSGSSLCTPQERNGHSAAFPIWRSHDMVNWDHAGYIFPDGHRPFGSQSLRDAQFWAPDIHQVGDHFVAYYAVKPRPDGSHVVARAVAPRYTGPWRDLGTLVEGSLGGIDPNLFRDPDSNRLYLYWTRQADTTFVQELNGAPVTVGGTTYLAGTTFAPGSSPTQLDLGPAYGWERSPQTDAAGNEIEVQGHVVEGPWMHYRRSGAFDAAGQEYRYFLFYSGSSYRGGYAVGVARATTPLGPFEKLDHPILTDPLALGVAGVPRDATWWAPGHNSVMTDAHGHDIIVYHAIPHEGVCVPLQGQMPSGDCWIRPELHRITLMDPLEWVGGWPRLLSGRLVASDAEVRLP